MLGGWSGLIVLPVAVPVAEPGRDGPVMALTQRHVELAAGTDDILHRHQEVQHGRGATPQRDRRADSGFLAVAGEGVRGEGDQQGESPRHGIADHPTASLGNSGSGPEAGTPYDRPQAGLKLGSPDGEPPRAPGSWRRLHACRGRGPSSTGTTRWLTAAPPNCTARRARPSPRSHPTSRFEFAMLGDAAPTRAAAPGPPRDRREAARYSARAGGRARAGRDRNHP